MPNVVPRITADRAGQSNSRGVGWEFVHVSIDDASRLAFSQILPDEKAASAAREPPIWIHRYQLASAPRRYKLTDPYQQTSSLRGQPLEAPQLERYPFRAEL